MGEKPSFEFGRKSTGTYFVVLAVLGIAAAWTSAGFQQYTFNEITVRSITSILVPMFVIAVFLERAQEVFVSAWRELKRHELDHEQDVALALLAKAIEGNKPDEIAEAEEKLAEAKWCVEQYKAQTRKHAFLLSLCGGVIISTIGVRILYPLMSWDIEHTGLQKIFFNLVDIFLTGGLIGGGSEGVHHVMNLILNRAKAGNTEAEYRIKIGKQKIAGIKDPNQP